MPATVLYVYAITRQPVKPHVEAIDQSDNYGSARAGGLSAVFTPVSQEAFSQEAIDRRAGDLEWIGQIGYRHQAVIAHLMRDTAVIPLRAFTLFSGEEALKRFLTDNAKQLGQLLERLDGKQEWTLRIEFDPQRWHDALLTRVASLRELQQQIDSAAPGKAFLLRKKLDEEVKRASRAAEQEVVADIEKAVLKKLACQTVAESRQQREGAFPQINVLLNRDEEARVADLQRELSNKYSGRGITLAVTGPWPPYTFASMADNA
jgi:hypothetical protein